MYQVHIPLRQKKPALQQICIEKRNILLPLIMAIWVVLAELSTTQPWWAALLYLTYNFAYTWYHLNRILPAESHHELDNICLYKHPNPSSSSWDTHSHLLNFSKSIFLYWSKKLSQVSTTLQTAVINQRQIILQPFCVQEAASMPMLFLDLVLPVLIYLFLTPQNPTQIVSHSLPSISSSPSVRYLCWIPPFLQRLQCTLSRRDHRLTCSWAPEKF